MTTADRMIGISCDDTVIIEAMPCHQVIQTGRFALNEHHLDDQTIEVVHYDVVSGIVTLIHPVAGESKISAKLFCELYIPMG